MSTKKELATFSLEEKKLSLSSLNKLGVEELLETEEHELFGGVTLSQRVSDFYHTHETVFAFLGGMAIGALMLYGGSKIFSNKAPVLGADQAIYNKTTHQVIPANCRSYDPATHNVYATATHGVYDKNTHKPIAQGLNPYDPNTHKPIARGHESYDPNTHKPIARGHESYDPSTHNVYATATHEVYDKNTHKSIAQGLNSYDPNTHEAFSKDLHGLNKCVSVSDHNNALGVQKNQFQETYNNLSSINHNLAVEIDQRVNNERELRENLASWRNEAERVKDQLQAQEGRILAEGNFDNILKNKLLGREDLPEVHEAQNNII